MWRLLSPAALEYKVLNRCVGRRCILAACSAHSRGASRAFRLSSGQIKKDRMEEKLRLARLSQHMRLQDEGRGRLSHLYKKILTALHRQRKVCARTFNLHVK